MCQMNIKFRYILNFRQAHFVATVLDLTDQQARERISTYFYPIKKVLPERFDLN